MICLLLVIEGLPDASLEEESNTEEGQDQDKVDESDEAERRESIASGSLQQTQSDSQEASVKHTSSSEEQTGYFSLYCDIVWGSSG